MENSRRTLSINIRVSEDFKELVNREMKRRNCSSQRELIVKAVEYYAKGLLDEDQRTLTQYSGPGLKQIVTQYPGKCCKCGTAIPVGSIGWLGKAKYGREREKHGVLVCLDCMILSMGDRTLAKRYIKVRELQATIRGLRKEANELSDQLFDPDLFKRNERFQKGVQEAIEQFKAYFSGVPVVRRYLQEHEAERENVTGIDRWGSRKNEEEFNRMVLQQMLMDTLREAQRIAKGLEDFLYLQRLRLKKSKKKKVPAV